MKLSILSTVLLFFVALGLSGPQSLAIATTPPEAAAEEGAAAEEREEQVFRKLASRRRRIRGKKARRAFSKALPFMREAADSARAVLSFRFFLQSYLPPRNFYFLQVCRI